MLDQNNILKFLFGIEKKLLWNKKCNLEASGTLKDALKISGNIWWICEKAKKYWDQLFTLWTKNMKENLEFCYYIYVLEGGGAKMEHRQQWL